MRHSLSIFDRCARSQSFIHSKRPGCFVTVDATPGLLTAGIVTVRLIK